MTKEECMEALTKHANIKPVITSTEKENKEFFEEYEKSQSKEDRISEEETSHMIQKMISDDSPKDSDY
ncbi:A_thal_3526 domain-containing protein [Cephalotus follicularis]|uniref:A_thal_3526 domain-containing protein n=1 Tax=Cephalotus follicularis TaxID=3775 RepID=A0A1Q3CA26_CEPFO|nr:A_thal_3526 domain-containing protein [Cephalotus follicularis]